ncbi:MAG: patatin-like phospholipase family protein [Desulfosalsimonadaceae bacterium]
MSETDRKPPVIERALILSGGGARGSYQVGVIKYLNEIGWIPDLVCGTSIGAVNAAAYGTGISAEKMAELWFTHDRKTLKQFSLPGIIDSLKNGRKYKPPAETRYIRALLEKHIDIDALRNSRTRIIITALNMKTGQIRYFTQKVIEMDHIMASTAIPMVFPWQHIDGVPHWDAGLMANTPLMPALAWNAREILVVLNSPAGVFAVDEPVTRKQVFELSVEHVLIGSYMAMLPDTAWQNNPDAGFFETPLYGSPRMNLALKGSTLRVVAPPKMLGLGSMFNYSKRQAEKLIKEGYANAKMQLKPCLK